MFSVRKSRWRNNDFITDITFNLNLSSVLVLLTMFLNWSSTTSISTTNSIQNGYNITYDKSKAVIKIHRIGQAVPSTVMDLTQNMFAYVETNCCYFGSLGKRPQKFEQVISDNISRIIQSFFAQPKVFYAVRKLPQSQVQKRLVPSLGRECEKRPAWLVSETKPKSFHDINENPWIQTKTFVGLQGEKKGARKCRSVNYYTTKDYHISQTFRKSNHRNPTYQAKDDSLNNIKKVNNLPYVPSNSWRKGKPSFQYYNDYDDSVSRANPVSNDRHLSNRNQENKTVEFNKNQHKQMEPFPDKIVKDGQVFYRHDGGKQRDKELNFDHQSDGPSNILHKHLDINEGSPSENMPRSFSLLLDHVRQVGAQRPYISAAIAGASIKESSKGSISHVIGSAVNGGYFAASAKGYDNKGGLIHSHIHGTGKGVSGGASAIAPDREGEAFIQVDNSEKGLSIGQSSTHNGEAFVIANVDGEHEYHLQHGDNTSSYSDNYDEKKSGQTFGEAKSSLSPQNKSKPGNILKPKSESSIKKNYRKNKPQVGMGLIEDIVEEVHQPDVTSSKLSQNDEGYYRDFPNAELGHQSENQNFHKSKSIKIMESIPRKTLDINRTPTNKQEKGTVGLVTYPYDMVGSPPGPGELLTQAPDTFLPLLNENTEDNYFEDIHYSANLNNDYYLLNGKELNNLGNDKSDLNGIFSDTVKDQFDIHNTENGDYYPGTLQISKGTNQIIRNDISLNSILTTKHTPNKFVTEEQLNHRKISDNGKEVSYKTYFDSQGETQVLRASSKDHHLYTLRKEIKDKEDASHSTQPYTAIVNKKNYDDNVFNDKTSVPHLHISQPIPPKAWESFDSPTTESVVYQPYSSILDLTDPDDTSFFNIPYYTTHHKTSKVSPNQASVKKQKQPQPPEQRTIQTNSQKSYPTIDNFEPLHINKKVLTVTYPPFPAEGYSSEMTTKTPNYHDIKFTTAAYQSSYTTPYWNRRDANSPILRDSDPFQDSVTQISVERDTEDNYNTFAVNKTYTSFSVKPTKDVRSNIDPINFSQFSGMERKTKTISPVSPGSTQQFIPAEPGEPHLNVVIMDKNDKRKLFYQREGSPIEAGEKIPGAPGYRVPPGFRGRVVYGHSLPIELESKRAIKGYNTRVKVSPQTSYQGPIFASVSGPEAASKFANSPNSGIHITLNVPTKVSSNFRSESKPLTVQYSQNKTTGILDQNAGKQYGQYTNSNYQLRSTHNVQIDKKSANIFKNSNGQCGYYANECKNMYGPYQTQTLCVPTFIAVACCC